MEPNEIQSRTGSLSSTCKRGGVMNSMLESYNLLNLSRDRKHLVLANSEAGNNFNSRFFPRMTMFFTKLFFSFLTTFSFTKISFSTFPFIQISLLLLLLS